MKVGYGDIKYAEDHKSTIMFAVLVLDDENDAAQLWELLFIAFESMSFETSHHLLIFTVSIADSINENCHILPGHYSYFTVGMHSRLTLP